MRSVPALLEIGLVASMVALMMLWLVLPDASTAGKVLSVAMVAGVAVTLPWAQSAVLILLRRGSPAGVKAWKGALLLVGLGLLYWLAATFFDAGALQDGERSQHWVAETWLWHLAKAQTLTRLQAGAWWVLRWGVAGWLLPIGMEGAARGLGAGWLRAGMRPQRRWLYWATLLGVAVVGTAVTEALLPPRAGLSVVLEVAAAVLAIGVVFAIDVGGLCLLLALTATYLSDAERSEGRLAVGSEEPQPGRGGVGRLGRRRVATYGIGREAFCQQEQSVGKEGTSACPASGADGALRGGFLCEQVANP